MKPEEIEQGNVLIGKFDDGWLESLNSHSLGAPLLMHYPDTRHLLRVLPTHKLEYHSSWDWLMPVVEKIEQDEKIATMLYVNTWDNRGRFCFSCYRELDENKCMRNVFVEIATDSKLKSVFLGVLEFIRIYNDKKIPRTQDDFNTNYDYYRRNIIALQYEE